MDVQLSTILLLTGVVAAEIWQQKPPAEWSDKDCLKLMSKSAWAKESTLSGGAGPMRQPGMGRMEVDPSTGAPGPNQQIGGGLEPPGGGGGGGGMGGGRGGMGGGGGGGMGGMGGGGGVGGPGAAAMPKATVRWESAAPYQEAMKKMHAEGASASDVEGFYVITVSGLKLGLGRGGNSATVEQLNRARERMKDQTQLTRKGKDPINCAKVEGTPSVEGTTLRFYFPRSEPISVEDKDVQFETKMGPMELKTKFALKDMVWNGKLAI
ncbi:hypothetical protein F183_A33860 [Bryobacterales bacterium F-183]|nr:hypothetical protein F183_A33860 [Bryobacterales bacterium F-183]